MSARTHWTALAVIFASVLGLASRTGRADAKDDELAKLKGKWIATSVDEGKGMKGDQEKLHPFVVIFDGNKIQVIEGRAATQPSTRPANPDNAGTVTIDPSAKPPTMNWARDSNPKEVLGLIYKLDGDALTICFGRGGGDPPPADFKAEKGNMVMVLKREK